MITRPVGKRGKILTFDDAISLYYIPGSRCHILCDTHLGPASMDELCEHLCLDPGSDQIVVFNSHSDWDHVWGNCSFPGSLIIGHELCRRRMLERWEMDLMQNSSLQRGSVELVPPNLTFSERIILEDEGIEFFHAPGHTIDSAVCYDIRDNVLYLGDLVEDPIPYLDARDLGTYLETLGMLLNHKAEVLISAHSGIVGREVISRNIRYISGILDRIPMEKTEFGDYQAVHQWNLNMRIIWDFLETRSRAADSEDVLVRILMKTGDLHEITSERLSKLLESY